MLELQRASAGSGKTFTLAKKFIWYFITIMDEERGRRLRRLDELTDSLSHILAVTFTNKATNEMQQRIVEKLFLLGYPPAGGKKPDYMKDFLEDLEREGNPVSEKEVSEVSRRAVGILLNNYSDFHVSTIDSFFQQVLRTFAYESDLSDSYRIELDSDLLSVMAIDGLLEDINSGSDKTGASFWIDEIMDRARSEGKKWNIFAKSAASDSTYALLAESVKRLDNEEFKKIRRKLDEYFRESPDLAAIYIDLKRRYEGPVVNSHAVMLDEADSYRRLLRKYEELIDATDYKNFKKIGDVAAGASVFRVPKNTNGVEYDSLQLKQTKAYLARKKKGNTGVYQELEDGAQKVSEAFERWSSELHSPGFRHWNIYRENLPFMGMLQAIRTKRDEYLRENNAIELGETNSMLHDIIATEDTPFIYERIGTRINHYLIDEFQDTSEMQWLNMSPLLHESIGRGNGNLIIGDAKQSIYRFRNADSSLISQRIPDEFGGGREDVAAGSAQNTNWRSDLRVVQFNNSFFDFLSNELNRTVGSEINPLRRDYRIDYRNVVQHPRRKEEVGYVEVHNQTAGDSKWSDHVLWSVVDIVESALSRGFSLRDIAVLVRKNEDGEAVIATFMEHNAQIDAGGFDNEKPHYRIEYISEQSLKLSSSAAVSMVVSVLETISRGADPDVRNGEDRARRGVADWRDVACNYRFFALRNPELSTPESLARFFEEGADNDAIGKMLVRMQAVTLPALVESIIAEFIPKEIRKTDAVFLAAFQDLVLEYCESHPSDICSFLEWWDGKKKSAAISSPENMDAVNVMTVHKSKGLEFPVVIVPFANASFSDSSKHSEWRWVKPEVITTEIGPLPTYLPVETSGHLEGTVHQDILYEFYDLKKMDDLNSLYVAFTRAGRELYVFSTPPSKKGGTMDFSELLENFYQKMISQESEGIVELADPGAFGVLEEGGFRYGVQYDPFISDKEADENGEVVVSEIIMEDYSARPTPDFLLYRRQEAPNVIDAEDSDLSDDPDPRSEGNKLHEIMQRVKTRDDIPRAVRQLAIKGVISQKEESRFVEEVTRMTSGEGVRGWFDGGMRVIAERSLLRSGKKLKRPDRIMITEDGAAIVIDYKFGESEKSSSKYRSQVRGYVKALKDTGQYRSVTGYLWYVRLNRLEMISE